MKESQPRSKTPQMSNNNPHWFIVIQRSLWKFAVLASLGFFPVVMLIGLIETGDGLLVEIRRTWHDWVRTYQEQEKLLAPNV